MADNVQLNPGVGGATLRTLHDADGLDWPVGVFAYATSLSPGANAVQIVDSTHGLPVAVVGAVDAEQADETALNATVFQGGAWTVALAGGATVAVSGAVASTQSGSWTVGLAAGAEVKLSADAKVGLKAGSELVGKISAGVDGSTVYDGTAVLEPKFVKISASSSGDNVVVAAVANNKIRVLRWGLTASGDVNAKWRSNSADLTGVRSLTKYASAGGAYCPVGVFQTAEGEALSLNLDAAVTVGGEMTYVLVPHLGGPSGPGGGTGAN